MFISACGNQFLQARQIFSTLVEIPLRLPTAAELLRYFRIRTVWGKKQFAGLKHEDVQFLHEATKTFPAERFQGLYRAWTAGTFTESELRAMFAGHGSVCEIGFNTYIVRPQRFLSRLTGA